MQRTFRSDEEIEAQMVPQIVKVIYPLLIPVEQACIKIQAVNHERVTKAATEMWRSWRKAGQP
jgi:hypothetical protein